MESSRASRAADPDSAPTIYHDFRLISANGQWINPPDVSQLLAHASHFITYYGWAGGTGNGEWRKRDANCSPGQGSSGNDQLGVANTPSPAMEWTMAPGKIQSKL